MGLETNIESSSGNKGRITISEKDELIDLRTKQTILEYLEPIKEKVETISDVVIRIESKVQVHNNYESRIRALERNQWRVLGIYAVVIAVILFTVSKL